MIQIMINCKVNLRNSVCIIILLYFSLYELVNATSDRLLKVGFKKLFKYFKFKHKIKQI